MHFNRHTKLTDFTVKSCRISGYKYNSKKKVIDINCLFFPDKFKTSINV